METAELQSNLLKAMDKLVDVKLGSMSTTNSTIGVVSSDESNYTCKVKINEEEFECTIPEHLHSWIQKDDIVIVQDLYSNGQKRMIVGKTGQVQQSPSLVFYDKDKDKNTSGVDGLFDSEGNKTTRIGTVVKGDSI